MIFLFTDFGCQGPYLGQMECVLKNLAPGINVINLVSDATIGKPDLAAYLLAALSANLPKRSVFLCIVDPGVGGDRQPIVLKADEKWFVGPDNGLLNTVALHAEHSEWWIIKWRPQSLSPSFHGRDLFAPIAAHIANSGDISGLELYPGPDLTQWQEDLYQAIYIDHYGNVMTGLRYVSVLAGKTMIINGKSVSQSNTFCSVPEGQSLWYRNSSDLVEIAVNQGNAQKQLGLSAGDRFCFRPGF